MVDSLRNVEIICMHNAGSFLYCNKEMLDNSYGSAFLYFDFSFIRNYKMSDETYDSDGFRKEFLHDERGKLIKGDSLFNNIYDFWVCIHAAKFMKVNQWYHPKTANLEKVLCKKWEKTKDLPIISILLRKIRDGDDAFNPKDYLRKDEEQLF